MKISIIGVFPPPIGGVSTHVKNLSARLHEDKLLSIGYDMWRTSDASTQYPSYIRHFNKRGILFKYDTISSIYWLFSTLRKDKAGIIHCHEAPLYTAFTFILMRFLFNKKIIYTVHDQTQLVEIGRINIFIRIWFYILIKTRIPFKWIAVSKNIKNQLLSLGVYDKDINVIPAYLPNLENGQLDRQIINFLKKKSLKLCFYSQRFQEDDIYGCWDTISMAAKLDERVDNLGLIMCIPSIRDTIQIKLLKRFISENMLEAKILIYENFITSLTLLFNHCDIYLRPTKTDGDAMAIREALYSHCVPIASDIVTRPAGCVTFLTGNSDDYLLKTLDVIENLSKCKENINTGFRDYYKEILSVYQSAY
jgi:glycosyltransferase involved in cell wall biosynthesis